MARDLSPENCVQIYCARLQPELAGHQEQAYLPLMPADVRAAIAFYRRQQDRQAVLLGKILLRRALRLRFPQSGSEKFQSLATAPQGKPFVAGGPEFNLSHAGEWVVLAMSPGNCLGIDIEEIREIELEDFFRALPEIADWEQNYGKAQARRLFFDCWTQKEAVLKASGQGLLAPMDQVRCQDGSALFADRRWCIKKIDIAAGYSCHLATVRPVEAMTVERVYLGEGCSP